MKKMFFIFYFPVQCICKTASESPPLNRVEIAVSAELVAERDMYIDACHNGYLFQQQVCRAKFGLSCIGLYAVDSFYKLAYCLKIDAYLNLASLIVNLSGC